MNPTTWIAYDCAHGSPTAFHGAAAAAVGVEVAFEAVQHAVGRFEAAAV